MKLTNVRSAANGSSSGSDGETDVPDAKISQKTMCHILMSILLSDRTGKVCSGSPDGRLGANGLYRVLVASPPDDEDEWPPSSGRSRRPCLSIKDARSVSAEIPAGMCRGRIAWSVKRAFVWPGGM